MNASETPIMRRLHIKRRDALAERLADGGKKAGVIGDDVALAVDLERDFGGGVVEAAAAILAAAHGEILHLAERFYLFQEGGIFAKRHPESEGGGFHSIRGAIEFGAFHLHARGGGGLLDLRGLFLHAVGEHADVRCLRGRFLVALDREVQLHLVLLDLHGIDVARAVPRTPVCHALRLGIEILDAPERFQFADRLVGNIRRDQEVQRRRDMPVRIPLDVRLDRLRLRCFRIALRLGKRLLHILRKHREIRLLPQRVGRRLAQILLAHRNRDGRVGDERVVILELALHLLDLLADAGEFLLHLEEIAHLAGVFLAACRVRRSSMRFELRMRASVSK